MDTAVKNSPKQQIRRKKRQRELKLLTRSKSPSRNLGIKNHLIRKENIKNIKKIKDRYLGSLVQSLCQKHTSVNHSQDQGLAECEHHNESHIDQTIDLCDAESLVEDSRPNVSRVSSCEVKQNSELVIDLCQDQGSRNEVIDLTEAINTSRVDLNDNQSEPIIIDLSEDDNKDEHNHKKPENDEISVIGTFSKTPCIPQKSELLPFISLSCKWNNLNNLINCSQKLKKKSKKKRSVLKKIDNRNFDMCKGDLSKTKGNLDKVVKVAALGENIYVNSPVTLPSKGLRPIIIDGSNVAFVHSNSNFCCKRLQICINYFKEKGHKVTAFVPQFRINSYRSDDPQLLRKLERQGDVVLTPSKRVDGRYIVPYDDRFIVQTAVLKGGIIVSRDNYNDLLRENPAWAETIKYRVLAFTWVDDVLMFPKDPLGEHGPTLEDFLRFH